MRGIAMSETHEEVIRLKFEIDEPSLDAVGRITGANTAPRPRGTKDLGDDPAAPPIPGRMGGGIPKTPQVSLGTLGKSVMSGNVGAMKFQGKQLLKNIPGGAAGALGI